jgi:DNA mismatch repair protein MutS
MTFSSILFPGPADVQEPTSDPQFFGDLHLDDIADRMFAGREGYNLRPLFRMPLRDKDAIAYRHEILRDLEHRDVREAVSTFAESMSAIRDALVLTTKLSYAHERERWVLDAANRYRDAIEHLGRALTDLPIVSRGLHAFRDYLAAYRASASYRKLASDIERVRGELSAISYAVLIDGDLLNVRRPGEERDLVAAVHETFARFREGAAMSHLLTFVERPGMNHIEEKVLEFVALLHPSAFAELDAFAQEHTGFVDAVVARFDREVQFYVASAEYATFFEAAGLPMCLPQVEVARTVSAEQTFDAALAQRLVDAGTDVVPNDFTLHGEERVFVVSGPNQGGKTTFARTFGQLHYLAALGCRVPGQRVTVSLFDEIFTHFERQEDPSALHGKLEDDVIRIHEILAHATDESIIILNEIFASTTVRDASILARRIMDRILELDCLCVCVTFLDELSTIGAKTVSMVSLVDAANPDIRTFKIARRPADGLAYAISLADKYALTYERLRGRLSQDGQP